MLMGMGALATIGVQRPANLTVAVIDNERYGETGMQATHTASGVDLAAIAKACGFLSSRMVTKMEDFHSIVHTTAGPNFLQIKVIAEKLPLVLPPQNGVLLKDRFRRALLG
jgi:thiamine pyrophosphate-dependent acetolactate synthase large subunit-like protein